MALPEYDFQPCPWCDTIAGIQIVKQGGMLGEYPEPDRTYVKCYSCGSSGPVIESPHVRDKPPHSSIVEGAVARWNHQARIRR